MDTNIAQKIARAFVHGLAFAKGMATLAQDAKAKMEEGDKWITIGAEPGDDGKKHGGRHVLISGTGEVKAGLSKSAQGKPLGEAVKELKDKAESKKAEGKKAEPKTKKAETPRAGLLTEQGAALAQLAEREYDKVITAIKDDVSSLESDPTFPPEVKRYDTVPIKSNLRNIKDKLSDVNKDLSTVKEEVSKAVKDGNFNRQGVESVWRAMKQLKDRTAYVVSHANSETAWLGRNNTRGMTETAETLDRLSNEASGIRQDANRLKEEVRGSIAQFERENTENKPAQGAQGETAREVGLRMQRAGKEAGERAAAKRAKAEIDRMYAQKRPKDERLINGPARATEPQSKSVSLSADDKKALKQIKDLVPKIGPVFHQAKSDLEFYSPSEKRGILKEVRFPDAQVTENIKYLNELEGYVKKEKEVRALAKDLDAAVKAGKLTPEDRNIYVRNLKYGFDELTKGIQRGAHALYDYAERANRGGYVSTLDDQWIREAVRQARGGLSHITWTADKLKASQPSISSESDRVDAMYAQKGSKSKQRIIN